jgi:hypothetical protein
MKLRYNNKFSLKKKTRNKAFFKNKINDIIRKSQETLLIIIFSKQEYSQT